MFLEMNGHCGTRPAPGRLPLLSGPSVTSCPTAAGLHDSDVLVWGQFVDAWSKDQPRNIPPRARAVVRMVTHWKSAPEYLRHLRNAVGDAAGEGKEDAS